MFEELWKDLQNVEEQAPIVPAGTYQAVVTSVTPDVVDTQDGQRSVFRVQFTLQGNPGAMLTDNKTPVDGQSMEYTLFIPEEQDKLIPSRYGRGSMYDVGLRRIKRFLSRCGVDLTQYKSLDEALQACIGATVAIVVDNRQTEDGILYDRVSRLA